MPGSQRDAPWTVAVTPVRLQREINFPLGTLVVKVIRDTQKDERRPLILENGCAEFVRLGLVASLALSFEFASHFPFYFRDPRCVILARRRRNAAVESSSPSQRIRRTRPGFILLE